VSIVAIRQNSPGEPCRVRDACCRSAEALVRELARDATLALSLSLGGNLSDPLTMIAAPVDMPHGKEKLNGGRIAEATPEWTICAYLKYPAGQLAQRK